VFGAETTIQIPRVEACSQCQGSGSAPGTAPSQCPTCHGAGQVAFQQGFFSVARTCSRCRGTGRIVTSPCTACHGQGQVRGERRLQLKIPPGVDTGSQLRITGEGDAGPSGGPAGDLYVVVAVKEHDTFRREDTELLCELPVTFPTAVLGGHMEVPTLDGGKTRVTIPQGTQPGAVLRVRGQGASRVGGKHRGDLHVLVRVEVPTKLSPDQRRLIEELAGTMDQPIPRRGKDKSLKDRVKDMLG
jgi:molecular chaperone DnaJ